MHMDMIRISSKSNAEAVKNQVDLECKFKKTNPPLIVIMALKHILKNVIFFGIPL